MKIGFKAPKPAAIKPTSASGNLSLSAMLPFMMLKGKLGAQSEAEMSQKSAMAGSAVGQARSVASQFGGSIPVGTQIDYGDVKIPLNRKYTADEARTVSSSDALSRSLNFIKNAQSSPNFRNAYTKATLRIGGGEKGMIGPIPTAWGDAEATKLSFHINELSNRLLYLRSGAQINEREFARLSRTLPSLMDISDPNDINYSALNEKLDFFEQDMQTIKDRLIQGGQYDQSFWSDDIPKTPTAPVGINQLMGQQQKNPYEGRVRKNKATGVKQKMVGGQWQTIT